MTARFTLAIDVGNTDIVGGFFEGAAIRYRFRLRSRAEISTDELGLFLLGFMREHSLSTESVEAVAIASVVPTLDRTVRTACVKYLKCEAFVLTPHNGCGVTNRCTHPASVGADRIANAIAASHLFPKENCIIIDFGTAITIEVLTAAADYLGGVIVPGPRLAMEALFRGTAKLPQVEIVAPERVIGTTTSESVQSGLYFGTLALVEGLLARTKQEAFDGLQVKTVSTGGFGRLFASHPMFDVYDPDLVLKGLLFAVEHASQ